MTKPSKDSSNESVNAPETKTVPDTNTRERQINDSSKRGGARTMLNFVSKQPAQDSVDMVSDHHHGNQDDDLKPVTPSKKRKRELPRLPFMPTLEDPAAQRPRTDAPELAIPSPSQVAMSLLNTVTLIGEKVCCNEGAQLRVGILSVYDTEDFLL